MRRDIALELMHVVGLDPAHQCGDEKEILFGLRMFHDGLLWLFGVAMVPIIRFRSLRIIALMHRKTVTYSHFG